MDPLTIASFCTGYGGLDLGVHQCARAVFGRPARTVLHVEREAFCAELLASRMDEEALAPAPLWSDLTTLDGGPWRGVVDCVIAGIPCQGNSLAGKRLLGDDPRDLWPTTRRLLCEMEPWLFFLENVYGFVVPDRANGRTAPIARVLGELAQDGWDAEWIVLPASAVGAPHKRERLFLLAVNRANQRAHGQGGGRGGLWKPPRRDGLAECRSVDVVHTASPRRGERPQPEQLQRPKARRGLPREPDRELGDARRELPQGVGSAGPACGPTRRAGRATLGAFPPGPGLGLDGVVDQLRKLLRRDPRAAWQRYQAERANTMRWLEILEQRPDLVPAIETSPESEVRRVAHGRAGRLDRLRALGNGVVPAQAAHALTILAERLL